MKRKIEISLELPEYLDDNFIEMLSMLDESDFAFIKGIVQGILFQNGKLSIDDFSLKKTRR